MEISDNLKNIWSKNFNPEEDHDWCKTAFPRFDLIEIMEQNYMQEEEK